MSAARDPLAAEREALEAARIAWGERAGQGASTPPRRRLALAAAHVCFRGEYARVPHTPQRPGTPGELAAAIDWDATASLRQRLDRHGFGLAEAMDTAQRFELGWIGARRLIEEAGALRLEHGFAAGVGCDQRERVDSVAELADAVAEQAAVVQAAGGVPIVLPLPWLAGREATESETVDVYGAVLARLEGPVFLHWLGPAFRPDLAGYFPGRSLETIAAAAPEVVAGVKVSLLDPVREVALRRALLPRGQVVLTGDDWAFAGLIEGGGAASVDLARVEGWRRIGPWEVALGDFSHALLGILDGTAAAMELALGWLDLGELARWRGLAEPCEALGRVVFEAPTAHYKVGLAWLAAEAGLQPNALLANHLERCREPEHLERVRRAAIRARLLPDD